MITALILGLIAGSFTGVVCYRIPRNKSILFPGSRCDSCMAKIAIYRNIPILSFLLQNGKCHNCGKRIRKIYFVLEILMPSLFLILYLYYGLSLGFFYRAFVFSILIAASLIDIETHIIPDRFYIILIISGFIFSILRDTPESWFLGMAAYGLPVLLLYSASDFIHKEIIGFGDVKLICAVGGFISYSGLKNLLWFYETLYICAGIFSIFLILFRKRTLKCYMAFAPFICLSAFISGVFL